MTTTQTFRVGQMVWDHGSGEFGDGRRGGMVVRLDTDATTGESQVVVITAERRDSTDKRPSLIVHHHDGRKGTARPAYEDIGAVARLVRMPVTDVDPNAASDFRHHAKVLDHARLALFAAAVALLPDYFDLRSHDSFVTVYRTLRDEAVLLQRGEA